MVSSEQRAPADSQPSWWAIGNYWYTLGGMKIAARRSALLASAAAAALVATMGLAGCSSEDTAATDQADTSVQGPSAPIAAPEAPVRVGVPEFADVIGSPGVTIVDVRTPEEYAQGHIEGAVNIPVEYPDFMDRVGELDPAGTYAVYCRSGNRSQAAVAGMSDAGINGIYELESGTNGWSSAGQPLVQ